MDEIDLLSFKDLLRILEPYAEFWQTWTKSKDCFLSKVEVQVIESYLYFGQHKVICDELNLTLLKVSVSIHEAKIKLITRRHLFNQWRHEYSNVLLPLECQRVLATEPMTMN
jgi:hypothetical protein